MTSSPISKPTNLHAPGALAQLFAYNRQLFGGWFMEGGGDGDGGGGDGGSGGGAGDGAGGGGGGDDGSGGGRTNATDAQGNDLGFPKDTPIAEMSDKEQAAYWRNNARKHEGRVKDLVGDRDPADVKKDLEAYAQFQKDQLTPAEQQLAAARDEGKKEATASERTKAATAIFRGALEAGGIEGNDLDELVNNLTVANFVGDDGVDTTKLTNFAKRFVPSDKDSKKDRRDFGGGHRRDGQAERGSAGKAEAQRRFKKKTTTSE